MKTMRFTYDVWENQDGEVVFGETCMDITMLDDIANKLTDAEYTSSLRTVEDIIHDNEMLKGRFYVKHSIKDIEEVIAK